MLLVVDARQPGEGWQVRIRTKIEPIAKPPLHTAHDLRVAQPAVDRRDAAEWKLGMTIEVIGPVDKAFTSGTATHLKSMAQMRGAVETVDTVHGSFALLGSTVGVDDETVWADLPGLAGLVLTT